MKRVKFNAGKANKLIILQAEQLTSDGQGGSARSWATVGSEFAVLRPVTARERYRAQALRSETTHDAMIRYRTDVVGGMRFTHAGRVFNILAVTDREEAHVLLDLECQEVQGETP